MQVEAETFPPPEHAETVDTQTSTNDITTSPSSSLPFAPASTNISRRAAKQVKAFETAEGVGARVRRSIGTPSLWNLSPFLILDYARVGKGEGFPDHPHRGMSTVTYVLEGKMQHEDFLGNSGQLSPGDVQWMTAGRGIVHSEMPLFEDDDDDGGSNRRRDKSKETPASVALQLWVDLPAAKKMIKPSYQEKRASALQTATFAGGQVTVISGESHGARGLVRPVAGCWFLDFRLEPGADVWQPLPDGWTAFAYVLTGGLVVGDDADSGGISEGNGGNVTKAGKGGTPIKPAEPHHCVVFTTEPGQNGVRLRTDPAMSTTAKRTETRFIIAAGEPLNQPMVQQGPFVVTSKEAAVQALRDYQGGKNGFEKAPGWVSKIGAPIRRGLRR